MSTSEIDIEQSLLEKIRTLHYDEKISQKTLSGEIFLDTPDEKNLKKLFRSSWFYKNNWPWHNVVSLTLEPFENRQYMYDRLILLLRKHRRSIETHFQIKFGKTEFHEPNPLAELNRLEIVWKRYFEIYRSIIKKLSYESPKIKNNGIIKGSINWNLTLKESKEFVPRVFVTSAFKKNYVTPENILLLLCAYWLKKESVKILQIPFVKPLSPEIISLLNTITTESSKILKNFPIQEIISESKKFWNLSYENESIKLIQKETKSKIQNKKILNKQYQKLLEWILDFQNLELRRISAQNSPQKIIDSIKTIDTVFEAWIYFEFLDFIYLKGLLLNSLFEGGTRYFTFEYNSKKIDFHYEKSFNPDEGHAWAKRHDPDFTAMEGNKILAIFDAKNYGKKQSITDTLDKMLSYMNNLNANFGALIYSYHPFHWDDLDKQGKIEKLNEIILKKFPDKDSAWQKNEKKRLAKLVWIELPAYLQEEFPRNFKKLVSDKGNNKFLGQLRMTPMEHKLHRELTDKTLNFMFESIIKML